MTATSAVSFHTSLKIHDIDGINFFSRNLWRPFQYNAEWKRLKKIKSESYQILIARSLFLV